MGAEIGLLGQPTTLCQIKPAFDIASGDLKRESELKDDRIKLALNFVFKILVTDVLTLVSR